MSTLAEDFWAAQRIANLAEEKIGDMLDEILGADGWQDFDTDSYDMSIEIYGVSPKLELSDGVQATLRDAGFARCWTHVTRERHKDGERAYFFGNRQT